MNREASESARILPARRSDLPRIAELAAGIWPECFRDIISSEQCQYMLDMRYAIPALEKAQADGATFEFIECSGLTAGFGAHCPADLPADWKLWQIYLRSEFQGLGLGSRYIDHVTSIAQEHRRRFLVLTVNKRNHRARRLYERSGFRVRDSVCTSIGHGFFMDDYVMEKSITP